MTSAWRAPVDVRAAAAPLGPESMEAAALAAVPEPLVADGSRRETAARRGDPAAAAVGAAASDAVELSVSKGPAVATPSAWGPNTAAPNVKAIAPARARFPIPDKIISRRE